MLYTIIVHCRMILARLLVLHSCLNLLGWVADAGRLAPDIVQVNSSNIQQQLTGYTASYAATTTVTAVQATPVATETVPVDKDLVDALASALKANSSTLVLHLPPAPIGYTDASLWTCYNFIAPPSSPGKVNSYRILSDVYKLLLTQLKPLYHDSQQQLQATLGDLYTTWDAYRKQYNGTLGVSMDGYFAEWARRMAGDPEAAIAAFSRWLHDPVNVAQENVHDCEYFSGGCSCTSAGGYDADCGVPQFKPDYSHIRAAVSAAPSLSIDFASQPYKGDESDPSSASATSAVTRKPRHKRRRSHRTVPFFLPRAAGTLTAEDLQYQSTVNKLERSNVTVQGWFKHITVDYDGPVVPGSWFNPQIVSMARQSATAFYNPDNWQLFFGDNGMFYWMTSNLYLLSGQFRLTITVDTVVTNDEAQYVQRRAGREGVWPFYSFNGAAQSQLRAMVGARQRLVVDYGSSNLVAPVALASSSLRLADML